MTRNPFPGPQPYRASDRERFHGREDMSFKLEASILANRCVTVHGPSGAGKSSLVQASVLPSLAESQDARVVRVDGWPEGEDPVLWLALSMFTDLKLGDVTLGLAPSDAVLAAAKRAARASSRLMVVYLDQLEQLFYTGRSAAETEPFFACLQDLVELPLRTVRVVLSLREDYLGRFRDRLRDRGRVLEHGFRVGPLTVDELTSAVCQAAAGGDPPQTWSPDRTRTLMLQVRLPGQAATGEAEAQSAYAQIVCRALFQQRAPGGDAAKGDAKGDAKDEDEAEPILRGYLETTLSGLGALREPAQRLLEDHLVTADGSRTLRTEKELLRVVPAAELLPILKALEGAAILHAEEHQGSRYFEIGHDWLARRVFEQRQEREALEAKRREAEEQQRERERREEEMARRLAKVRRHRLTLLSVAAGAVVFAGVTSVLFYLARQDRQKAETATKEAHAAKALADRKRVEAADLRILAGYLALSSRGEQALGMKLLPEVKRPAERKGWVSYASDALASSPLRATLHGHTGPLVAAVFSPDGKRVLTAGSDGTARVWSADGTGRTVVLRGHREAVTSASFSPDGQRILTTSEDGTARVWKSGGDDQPTSLEGGKGSVLCGAWSADGKRVALGGEDGILRIHTVDGTSAPIELAGHGGHINDVAFLPDGQRVVSASEDTTARLWRVGSRDAPVKLGSHSGPVRTAAVSPDGAMVVTTSIGAAAAVLKLEGDRATQERTVDCGASDALHAAFGPGGELVAVACADGTARVAPAKGRTPPVILTGATAAVSHVAFRPDGKLLATASLDAVARVYPVEGGDPALVLAGHAGGLGAIAWSPDGSRLVTAAAGERAADHSAKIWSAEGQRSLGRGASERRPFHTASFGKGGALLVAAHDDGTATLRRVDGEGPVVVFKGHGGWVANAALSPAGDRVATAAFDRTARIFHSDGQGEPLVLTGHSGDVRFAAWSADGKRVVTAAEDRTARVWDATSGKELATLSGHEDWLTWAAWSPDGARIVTASHDRTARVFHSDGKGEPVVLRGHVSIVNSAVFTPDGKKVVTASEGGVARVWNADGTGEPVVLRGLGTGALLFAVVSADGSRVAAAGDDGLVHVWRADGSGEPVVLTSEEPPIALAFVDGDQALLAVLSDRSTHRWRIDVDALKTALRSANADCLPADVRTSYLDETFACATYAFELCESGFGRISAPVKPAACAGDEAPSHGGAAPDSGAAAGPAQGDGPGERPSSRRAADLGPEGRHAKVVVLPGDADVVVNGAMALRRDGAIDLVGKKGELFRLRVSKAGRYLEQDVTLGDVGASPPVVDLSPKIEAKKGSGVVKPKVGEGNFGGLLPDENQ